ncbi:MAG: HaeII family restriction endonuclease [Chlorobi bacterium]|nr:HaeII family restriction endonuclease [Chlorobiota bacterium]
MLNLIQAKASLDNIIKKARVHFYKPIQIGDKLLKSITNELLLEFPSSDNSDFIEFYNGRGYNNLNDESW